MQEMTETKKKGFTTLLRITALIAALVTAWSFAIPLLRKNSALGAVGGRALSELTPFSTAVAYYSGSEIAGLAKKPNPSDGSYRAVAELLSQVNIQQGYEKLYLIYRDGDKVPRYLEDGREFPLSAYRPVKSLLDKIYTGKSVGSYANDLVTREDQRQVAVACLPLYGSGRTVLAVLVAECDPGDTGYHLVGPVNLYYVGGAAGAVLLLCILILWGMRKYRLARTDREERAAAQEPGIHEEPIPPEDDFQFPIDSMAHQPPMDGQEGDASGAADGDDSLSGPQ